MTNEEQLDGMWERKKTSYPFHLTIERRKSPRPSFAETALACPVLSAPAPDGDVIRWGFKTEEARHRFLQLYGGVAGE